METVKERALGTLLGLAVNDALGTFVEFYVEDSGWPFTDIVGGEVFNMESGQWTDDTAMALRFQR